MSEESAPAEAGAEGRSGVASGGGTVPVAGGPRGQPSGTAAEQPAVSTEPEVVAAAAALEELDDLPVAEHVARYDALHGELSEALAAIDGV